MLLPPLYPPAPPSRLTWKAHVARFLNNKNTNLNPVSFSPFIDFSSSLLNASSASQTHRFFFESHRPQGKLIEFSSNPSKPNPFTFLLESHRPRLRKPSQFLLRIHIVFV
ncbi:hypothetical protein I3760_07G180900 [Carya illinoinensis]|nr:hypothetical protein I3760_07G180900 [Carya illinoinensis]